MVHSQNKPNHQSKDDIQTHRRGIHQSENSIQTRRYSSNTDINPNVNLSIKTSKQYTGKRQGCPSGSKNKVKKRQSEDVIQVDILIEAFMQTIEIYDADVIEVYLLSKEEYDMKLL